MARWVVVGGGTAGCVVAAALSADPARRVTLLEAGDDAGARGDSASSLADLARPGTVWAGLTAREPDGATRPYLQGRGLGGSSLVNGAVLSGVGTELLPAEVVADAELGPLDRALLAAAPDAGRAVLARRGGRLVSAAQVFLDPVRSRSNLAVVTGVPVSRVVVEGGRATGVVGPGGTVIEADEVVLCAGAIFTPALLRRSGLDRPGLGEVRDHPSVVVDLVLRPEASVPADHLATGAVLRRGGVEVVVLDHVGVGAPGRAALLVGALTQARPGRVDVDPEAPAGGSVVSFAPLPPAAAAELRRGLAVVESLLATPALRAVVAEHSVGPPGGYHHLVGSCRVGRVVDGAGRVVGCPNLYVADASVLDLPASGTFAPVVANASRLAGLWAVR